MIDLHELKLKIDAYESLIDALKASLHIDTLTDQIDELEQRSMEPGFWDEAERAQKIQQQISLGRRKIDRFMKLVHERDDMLMMLELAQEEEEAQEIFESLIEDFKTFEADYELMRMETLFTGKYDDNEALVTIHAGAGGTEAQDWASMLYRMYARWADSQGLTLRELDYQDGDDAGIKSVSFKISGEYAYGYLRSEIGVHRLVRISPFDASGRRHTSFASVEVMPELDNTIEINIRPEDLRVDTFRATGKGGQHVNKTESAIRLTHLPTGVVVSCQAERSQIQNKETAMNMLRSKLFALAEAAQKASIDELKGNALEIAWGSQIRSYVFCPYTLVKDHRTNYEEISVDDVMDGHLNGFMNAWLTQKAGQLLSGASGGAREGN